VCTSKGVTGRTITLKMKFSDFEQITQARSILFLIDSRETLGRISFGLLRDVSPAPQCSTYRGVAFQLVAWCRG
jgi:DNA polymerase-4